MNFAQNLLCLLALTISCSATISVNAAPKPPVARTITVPSTLLLAENSKATFPIVISSNASSETKTIAAELAGYLKRITGAEFEITAGDGKRGIVLGTIQEFPNPSLNKVLEVRNTYNGKEAFAIRTEPQRLLLIGASELSASHAAFRFLETLGVRQFFPGKVWEIVPTKSTLRVALNETDRPAFLSRNIWAGQEFGAQQWNVNPDPQITKDFALWRKHNRMAKSLKTYTGHSWPLIINANQEVFDANPEYYALIRGKRETPKTGHSYQLCVSQPEVRKITVKWVLDYFEKYPATEMVAVGPNDGSADCECEQCQAAGSISDRVFGLVNEAARAVQKEYPDKFIGVLAYSDYSVPPAFPLEPNVYIQLTAGYNFGPYSFHELLDMWSKKANNMGIYEYYSIWNTDYDRPPARFGANVKGIQERLKLYHRMGLSSVDAESSNNWGLYGRGTYIANRLMWNPDADVEKLLTDFYDKAFGPAAPAMKRYYERLDPGNGEFFSTHLLALAYRDLDEAARLAKDRPDVQARLDLLKSYMSYVHLRWRLDHEKDAAKKKELLLQVMTHLYRTKNDYMLFARPYLTGYTTSFPADFGEPGWDVYANPTTPKPWEMKEPLTREEIERGFQEGLEYFQPQSVGKQIEYSSDLLPVDFGSNVRTTLAGLYQWSPRHYFYSVGGEPLDVQVRTGTIYQGDMKPAAKYSLVDAAGKKIHAGQLPQDRQTHSLVLKVPKPGLYFFDYDSAGAGFYITSPQSSRIGSVLSREEFFQTGLWQPQYFFVPKGTKQIEYYAHSNKHEVWGPDEKLAHSVDFIGGYVTVPVPTGQDGKVWSLRWLGNASHLWFLNVPNYTAPSPNALLVPRELVKKDGLTIATK